MSLQHQRNARLRFTLRCRTIAHHRLHPLLRQSPITINEETRCLMHLFLRYLPDEHGFCARFPTPMEAGALKGRYCATCKYFPPDDVLQFVALDEEVIAFKAAIANSGCCGVQWYLCRTCDEQPKSFETMMLWKWAQFYALTKAPFCAESLGCTCPGTL